MFGPDLSGVNARLAALERKLDLILNHLGLPNEEDRFAEVRDLLAAGNKIGAIKLYRELTGLGLAEAKAAVERGL